MTEAAAMMPHFRPRRLRVLRLAALILACAALAAACSGGDGGDAAAPTASPAPTASLAPTATSAAAAAATPTAAPTATAAPSDDFPTGPAVLVAADYQPPGNRVDSTGAYLPANGKPTFVFFDAIW